MLFKSICERVFKKTIYDKSLSDLALQILLFLQERTAKTGETKLMKRTLEHTKGQTKIIKSTDRQDHDQQNKNQGKSSPKTPQRKLNRGHYKNNGF